MAITSSTKGEAFTFAEHSGLIEENEEESFDSDLTLDCIAFILPDVPIKVRSRTLLGRSSKPMVIPLLC